VAPPNGNCPSTTLNHVTVDPPRLLAPMPTVHHHVTDEAQMEPTGDVLPKWLGVILSVRIDRLSHLSAGTAVKGARNCARPPLSMKPGLCPASLLTSETIIALQWPSDEYQLYQNRKATLCVKRENKVTESDDSADYFNLNWTAEREFFDKK
jgi:hypothetical protein